jgi:hypothetical protein
LDSSTAEHKNQGLLETLLAVNNIRGTNTGKEASMMAHAFKSSYLGSGEMRIIDQCQPSAKLQDPL